MKTATYSNELGSPLLPDHRPDSFRKSCHVFIICSAMLTIVATIALFVHHANSDGGVRGVGNEDWIEAEDGVVAADDGRCSEIGASVMRRGGHAVDAAVATALCLGVVNPMSSGIGGGAFMVVRPSDVSLLPLAFDSRETAPLAASQDMYANNPSSKAEGALAAGVPGELAGLHAAWSTYGRLPWKSLFRPSIKLAREGFIVAPYLAGNIKSSKNKIVGDPGLRKVYAPNGKLLEEGETCYNEELANTLEILSVEGLNALYGGSIGEAFVRDVQDSGGIITMEDMRSYKVQVTEALEFDVLGYKFFGIPPPSSGMVGMSMVLNILSGYNTPDAFEGPVGLHRLIEALKHMFAIRMNLGDPHFVNVNEYVSKMLSSSFANKVREKIFDNTTFDSPYYMANWSQLNDHGTSHFCIVDADRNAVSITTTINGYFGAGVLSPSTGIILNNQMDDFSTPTENGAGSLPPAPANFILPKKRPLSSTTPIIVVKDNQLAGVVGSSGGMCIIPAVLQVFVNHFLKGMTPLAVVQHPRIYHKLFPNVVNYENLTAIDGERIMFSEEWIESLRKRGHQLNSTTGCSVCQLVVHNLLNANGRVRKLPQLRNASINVIRGMLTAVSDPRKNGIPT